MNLVLVGGNKNLVMDKRAWHKRANEVINTIEPRTGGSEQFKLI